MASFFAHWRDVFYDLFVPFFFFLLTIILRVMMRIRVVSGTDALAILGTIDWAASGGKIDLVKLFAVDPLIPGTREILFALMLACVLGMIVSVWLESMLENSQPSLVALLMERKSKAKRAYYVLLLVGLYLLVYTPAVFVAIMHLGFLLARKPV